MQISELSAVRVIADAREHSNGFDGHDRLSNDERCRERDIDDRLEHRGHGGGGGGAPPGPITLDPMVVIHPQPAPPPIVDLPPVAALPPDAPPPPAPPPRIPSFFQLTTFSGLRRDRTAEQALEDGEWTRTVTLPAVTVVAAAPAAGMLGAKVLPVVGRGVAALPAVAASRPAKETIYHACLMIGMCQGIKPNMDKIQRKENTMQAHEGNLREAEARRRQMEQPPPQDRNRPPKDTEARQRHPEELPR